MSKWHRDFSEEERRTLTDLTRLTKERVRKSTLSVLQLVDDDYMKAAILTSVALDMLTGAGVFYEAATGRDEHYAQRLLLRDMLIRLGIKPDELRFADQESGE